MPIDKQTISWQQLIINKLPTKHMLIKHLIQNLNQISMQICDDTNSTHYNIETEVPKTIKRFASLNYHMLNNWHQILNAAQQLAWSKYLDTEFDLHDTKLNNSLATAMSTICYQMAKLPYFQQNEMIFEMTMPMFIAYNQNEKALFFQISKYYDVASKIEQTLLQIAKS